MQSLLGKVYLVGAGAGDAELLTLKAVRCLANADAVLYDYLVDPETLQYVPKTAELIPLGLPHHCRSVPQSEVNRTMTDYALAGKTVVRLKGGDPHIFGHLDEETTFLRQSGVPFEVVPGITAGIAAACAAGIPLTNRRNAAVAFVTGHLAQEKAADDFDYAGLAAFPGTLVFYMGTQTAAQWSGTLRRGGMSAETPVVVVHKAGLPEQRTVRTTLADIAEAVRRENLQSPCTFIVGGTADSLPDSPV